MKVNKWTNGLAAAGVVSLASAAQAGDANETVMTAVSSTTLSGYVSTTAIWNPGTGNAASPGGSFLPGSGTGNDGFNLDVVSLSVSKPLDESEWAAGYNAQLWFGETVGSQTAFAGGGAVGIKNANVELRVPVGNGLDLKMGIFDAIIGYESGDFNGNPNYSRSYGWGMEPTTHEGLLASYAISDSVSVSAGIANTYSPTVAQAGAGAVAGAAESQKAYMAAIAVTLPDSLGFLSGGSIYAGVLDGLLGGSGAGTLADTTSIYAGAALPTPIEGLAAGIAFDYRFNGGPNTLSAAAGPAGSAWAYALAGYLSYDVTEKVAAHYRIDWAQGTDGTFGGGAIANASTDKVLSNTVTIDYKAWENVITRLEARWDHSLDAVSRYGITDRNDIQLFLNAIYQF